MRESTRNESTYEQSKEQSRVELFLRSIERVGVFALTVIAACVAIMLLVSVLDGRSSSHDSMEKEAPSDESPDIKDDSRESRSKN